MNSKMFRSATVALVLGAATVPAVTNASGLGLLPGPSLVGSWEVTVFPVNCVTGQELTQFAVLSYLTFDASGTLLETNSNADFQPGQRSAGHGYWKRTGRKAYHAHFQAFLQFDSVDPPPTARVYRRGSQTIVQDIELQDSNHWASDATVTFSDLTGATIFSSGCAKASAVRM